MPAIPGMTGKAIVSIARTKAGQALDAPRPRCAVTVQERGAENQASRVRALQSLMSRHRVIQLNTIWQDKRTGGRPFPGWDYRFPEDVVNIDPKNISQQAASE